MRDILNLIVILNDSVLGVVIMRSDEMGSGGLQPSVNLGAW